MSYRLDQQTNEIVIEGFETGIAHSPYVGIANMRNVNNQYYPSVAYVNYRRQAATLSGGEWYAGTHSTNVSNNSGWIFTAADVVVMGNPVQHATSPAGLNYILDSMGQVWKQTAVNSSAFTKIEDGGGRFTNGSGGIAYWNNYIVVFGNGVIEFCGNGTNDSGIISSNWNVAGIFYDDITNISFTPQQFQLSGSPSGTITSLTLASTNIYPTGGTSANWGYPTNTNATIILSTGQTITGVTVTNGSSTVSFSSTTITGSPSTLAYITSPSIYSSNTSVSSVSLNSQITFATTGTLPSPLVAGVQYYATFTAVSGQGGYIFGVSTTIGGTAIPLTTFGSNDTFSITSTIDLPIGNVSGLTFTNPIQAGSTTATISSYTLPNGTSINTIWLLPSGNYVVVDSNNNQLLASFTNQSSVVNFIAPTIEYSSGTYTAYVLNPNITSYRAYVSKVDGNLYFVNGAAMGAFVISNGNSVLNMSNPVAYNLNAQMFELSVAGNQGNDSIVDMTDLSSNMIVAGNKSIYTWDYVSPYTTAPVPIGEQTVRITNLLNNIYILAGQKGNIYTSNGSYAQLLLKIPDYISGVIDPVWTFGGIMTHRSRIYFQAMAQNTSGTNLLAGVFSIVVSPSILGEVASGITMEAQNSYGLIPSSGAVGTGILIDAEPSSNGQDAYYSAYSTGASSGGIDYNDTTLWQNFEPIIETDIIPIGSILNKQSLGQVQFKLDRPMATGDQIKMYWRPSLTDSYTLMGTTTTAQLSDYYPSTISQSQWIQFEIAYKCASSGSSFIPLREVRIQIT